jgi:hypothetical protein
MDPLEIGKFILMLGALAGIYLKINQAVRSATGKGEPREIANDPLNVREAPEFMSRRECAIHHHSFDARLTNLENRFDRHITDIKTTTDGLREDITDLRDRVDDQFATVNDSLREITRAVGRLEGA